MLDFNGIMTSLTHNGDGLVVKNDALGVDSACCCFNGVNCEEETRTYGYFDTVPAAPAFCDCACSSDCTSGNILNNNCATSNPCNIGSPGTASCVGDTLDCYVRSKNYSNSCGSPKATIYQNSSIDDYGTISGPSDTIDVADRCPNAGIGLVTATTTITPYVVDNGNGTKYLKLDVHVVNGANTGGPYGVASLSVRWWFD